MESISQPIINIQRIALVNGCILAVADIVMMLIVFYFMPDLMANMVFIGIQLLVAVAFIVYFSLDMRNKMGRYWSFKEAVTGIFIMLFLSALLTFGYTLLFGNLIDPSYPIKLKEVAIAKSTEVINKMSPDLDQGKIDEANAEIDIQFEKRFDPSATDVFQNVCIMAIMYFVISLVFAAIFKREKPVSIFKLGEEE